MSCASSHGPSTPRAPKSSTKIRPEITGDTLNGRSISVISALLPRNRYFAISQAAATPNTRFSGTQIAAVSSVSRIAAQRLGLGDRLDVAAEALAERLDEHGDERDARRTAPGTRSATPISVRRTHGASRSAITGAAVAPVRCRRAGGSSACSALMTSSSTNDATSITSAIAVAPA